MLRRTAARLVRDPVPTDTKAFYTWFSAQAYRMERQAPGQYPAVRMYPVWGKRVITGRTFIALCAAVSLFGMWQTPERERYNIERMLEQLERASEPISYMRHEMALRHYITQYKRRRYEEEVLIDKGYVGLTTEARNSFYYHDDVWRPAIIDVVWHPYVRNNMSPSQHNFMIGYF